MAVTGADWNDPDQGLFSISVAAQLAGDGLNLAGIRQMLDLQAETRLLQAEISRLRDR
ncbi:MAG TPA: hypothetical protein VGJ19_24960 [Streptosporangiaceae bacterium]